MKQKKMLLPIIVSFFLLLQFVMKAQEYVPFPDSGGVWKETYWWQPSPFFYNGIGDTYIEGDTIFNDTIYHKIYNLRRDVFCSDIIISEPEFYAALREDSVNNKVYLRWHANTNEKLIYDYTLQVGDTLPDEMRWFTYDDYGIYITEIDTITTFDGINRRVWHLDYEEPFPGWPQIIEGIGSTSGLLGGIEPYWEGWNELLCFSVDGDEVWRSFRDTCYVITDSCATVGVEQNEINLPNVKLFPNPVKSSGYFTLVLTEVKTVDNYLLIFDIYGNEITSIEFHDTSFTIESPAIKGLYIGKMFVNNQYYYTFKIIVN